MYDIIIKGGTVYDGLGAEPKPLDVGITGDRIAALGELSPSKETRVIDAHGLAVMPGVVDILNHSDTHWTLFDEPSQESLLRQGITTIIGGSCGSSLAPIISPKALESLRQWVDISRLNINWQTVEEYLKFIASRPVGVNYGTLVGHITLRSGTLRPNTKKVSEEHIKEMQGVLGTAFRQGAFGISFGLAFDNAETVTLHEMEELATSARAYNALAAFHLRDEGKHLVPSINEVVDIARTSGANIEIGHLKAIGQSAWEDFSVALDLLRRARADGLNIHADFFPYNRTGSLLYTLLPGWAKEGGKDAIMSRLRDPEKKRIILNDLKALTLHYDRVTFASTMRKTGLVGKTLADAALAIGLPPEEALLNVLLINELSVVIFGHTLKDDHLHLLLKEPYTFISSDGIGKAEQGHLSATGNLVHPRSYGTVPTALAMARDSKGEISLSDVIKKMTAGPAEKVGITDRGRIVKDTHADIVVFDPSRIRDNATYENPYRYPTGIEWVIINGNIAVEQSTYRGALAGKVLRSGGQ